MRKFLNNYGFLFAVGGIILILDQVSKTMVRIYLPLGDFWSPWNWLIPYARLVHISNAGAAFGMLPRLRDIFTILSIVVVIAILYYFPKVPRNDWMLRLAMGLEFGGALGNLADRLTQGYVTDFVSIGRFPVFNVADASISLGVVIMVLSLWSREKEYTPSEPADQNESASETPGSPLPEDLRSE